MLSFPKTTPPAINVTLQPHRPDARQHELESALTTDKLSVSDCFVTAAMFRQALQFGSREKFRQFSRAFKGVASLEKYQTLRLSDSYRRLPPLTRERLDKVLDDVTPAVVKEFKDTKKLGMVEECADTMFEYITFKSIQRGLVTEEKLKTVLPMLQRLKYAEGGPVAFDDVLAHYRSQFTEAEQAEFQTLSGVRDRSLSNNLLAVIALKFSLFMVRGKNENIQELTHARVLAETREFVDTVSHQRDKFTKGIESFLVNIGAKAMLAVKSRGNWFLDCLQRLVSDGLMLGDINRDDLIRFLLDKQLGRQELDYSLPDHNRLGYEERKKVLKPVELILEVQALQALKERGYYIKPSSRQSDQTGETKSGEPK